MEGGESFSLLPAPAAAPQRQAAATAPVWDRERDMSVRRPLGEEERQQQIREAAQIDTRFSSSTLNNSFL